MQILEDIRENEYVNERHPFFKDDNLTNTVRELENGMR